MFQETLNMMVYVLASLSLSLFLLDSVALDIYLKRVANPEILVESGLNFTVKVGTLYKVRMLKYFHFFGVGSISSFFLKVTAFFPRAGSDQS